VAGTGDRYASLQNELYSELTDYTQAEPPPLCPPSLTDRQPIILYERSLSLHEATQFAMAATEHSVFGSDEMGSDDGNDIDARLGHIPYTSIDSIAVVLIWGDVLTAATL